MQTLTLTPPLRPAAPTVIQIGSGAAEQLATLFPAPPDGSVVIADRRMESFARSCAARVNPRSVICIDALEQNKTLGEAERIAQCMLDAGCARNTLMIAVGGGMVTDLAGFIASIYMRGMPCVHVPTTLLAMVDAAVGGKSAINVGHRKNMLGSVHHPKAVLIDTDLLRSMPDVLVREGLVEVIKIALIADGAFFQWIERSLRSILDGDLHALSECVVSAVKAKAEIVQADDRDHDRRLWLNFGHTVGHAVEAASLYRSSHAASVGIGMMAELRLIDSSLVQRLGPLLKSLGIPTEFETGTDPEILWSLMLSDKKCLSGDVRMAVPESIGRGEVVALSRQRFLSLFSS